MVKGGAQENTLATVIGVHGRGWESSLVTGPALGPEGSLEPECLAAGVRSARPSADCADGNGATRAPGAIGRPAGAVDGRAQRGRFCPVPGLPGNSNGCPRGAGLAGGGPRPGDGGTAGAGQGAGFPD